jgi:hypothetical protein
LGPGQDNPALCLMNDNRNHEKKFKETTFSKGIVKERFLKRETGHRFSDARFHHYEGFKQRFESLDELGHEMHSRVDTEKLLEKCMDILGNRSNRNGESTTRV